MSGRNLDFQSSCCSAIIIRHLQGPLVSGCPQPCICRAEEQRQNTWPYRGQIRETERHPTKGTRQIPSGYGQAPVAVQVRHRLGGRQTHGRGREAIGERGHRWRKSHTGSPQKGIYLLLVMFWGWEGEGRQNIEDLGSF